MWLIPAVAVAFFLFCAPAHADDGNELYDLSSLHQIDLVFPDPQWWDSLLAARETGGLLPASLVLNGGDPLEVGVRFHGKSSFSPYKYSRKVPFWVSLDHVHPEQRLDGRATLILKNNYLDPSLLREVLALKLLGHYLHAPRANFVGLSINGESWGVYVNIELPDRAFMGRHFSDGSGPIHIGERAFSAASLRRSPCPEIFPQVNALAPDACPQIAEVLALLESTDLEERRGRLPALLDVDNVLRHLAAETMLGHTDGFPGHNYTLYRDPRSGRLITIPWDFNAAFRVGGMALKQARGILADPVWYARYRGYVRTMIEASLAREKIDSWIRDRHRLLGASVKADDKALYPYEGFVENARAAYQPPDHGSPMPGLLPVIEGRSRWLAESGMAAKPRVELCPVEPEVENLDGTARVRLWVRAQGGSPVKRVLAHVELDHVYRELEMREDGDHGVGGSAVRTFTTSVELPRPDAPVQYYFSVESQSGDVSFLPSSGGFRPYAVNGRGR